MNTTVDRPSSTGEDLAAALDEGIESVVAALPPSLMETPSYPVQVTYERLESPNRFWAIPVIGFVAKLVILIPHLIALSVLATIALLMQLFLWIPVLARGEYPEGAYAFVSGTMGWMVRVLAYLYGFTDRYPPFSLHPKAEAAYPVSIRFERQQQYNKAWALPAVGLLVKSVLLIPHVLIIEVLRVVSGALFLVTWVPVLFSGRYPEWGYQLMGGYVRWSVRVYAYLLGLTDRYPPFQLG